MSDYVWSARDEALKHIIRLNKRYFFNSSDANLPDNVIKVASKELRRLKKMSPQMPEYPMLRHYLELVADLPWDKTSNETIDIRKAKEVSSPTWNWLELIQVKIMLFVYIRSGGSQQTQEHMDQFDITYLG